MYTLLSKNIKNYFSTPRNMFSCDICQCEFENKEDMVRIGSGLSIQRPNTGGYSHYAGHSKYKCGSVFFGCIDCFQSCRDKFDTILQERLRRSEFQSDEGGSFYVYYYVYFRGILDPIDEKTLRHFDERLNKYIGLYDWIETNINRQEYIEQKDDSVVVTSSRVKMAPIRRTPIKHQYTCRYDCVDILGVCYCICFIGFSITFFVILSSRTK